MEVFSGYTFFDSFVFYLNLLLCSHAVSLPEAVYCSEEQEKISETGLVMELGTYVRH